MVDRHALVIGRRPTSRPLGLPSLGMVTTGLAAPEGAFGVGACPRPLGYPRAMEPVVTLRRVLMQDLKAFVSSPRCALDTEHQRLRQHGLQPAVGLPRPPILVRLLASQVGLFGLVRRSVQGVRCLPVVPPRPGGRAAPTRRRGTVSTFTRPEAATGPAYRLAIYVGPPGRRSGVRRRAESIYLASASASPPRETAGTWSPFRRRPGLPPRMPAVRSRIPVRPRGECWEFPGAGDVGADLFGDLREPRDGPESPALHHERPADAWSSRRSGRWSTLVRYDGPVWPTSEHASRSRSWSPSSTSIRVACSATSRADGVSRCGSSSRRGSGECSSSATG